MTERRYLFTFTRFACGCAYRTVGDTAVFCPQHRAISTGTERTLTPGRETPDVPGLVMSPYMKGVAHTLRNTPHNSLHTMTSVLDAQDNEWAEPSEDLAGMCAACFIDQEERSETGVAMCECGNENCSYRWCGSPEGLHAFWRLHVLGKSEETTGIPDRDIFSHGPYAEQRDEVTAVLDREREDLQGRAVEMMKEMETARERAETPGQDQNPQAQNPQDQDPQAQNQQSVYLTPWLDRDYREMKEEGDPRAQARARRALTQKLTRLQVIGALPPSQPQEA